MLPIDFIEYIDCYCDDNGFLLKDKNELMFVIASGIEKNLYTYEGAIEMITFYSPYNIGRRLTCLIRNINSSYAFIKTLV